jgi:hypothetical protein
MSAGFIMASVGVARGGTAQAFKNCGGDGHDAALSNVLVAALDDTPNSVCLRAGEQPRVFAARIVNRGGFLPALGTEGSG